MIGKVKILPFYCYNMMNDKENKNNEKTKICVWNAVDYMYIFNSYTLQLVYCWEYAKSCDICCFTNER